MKVKLVRKVTEYKLTLTQDEIDVITALVMNTTSDTLPGEISTSLAQQLKDRAKVKYGVRRHPNNPGAIQLTEPVEGS